jgi:hypothetical protein
MNCKPIKLISIKINEEMHKVKNIKSIKNVAIMISSIIFSFVKSLGLKSYDLYWLKVF